MSGKPLRVLMITCEWPTPENPTLSPFVKQQVEFLQATGVDVDVYKFRGRKNPVNYLKAWWGIRRRLAGNRYDLVHAQHGQSGLVALPKRLPLVVTFHGSDLQGIVGDVSGRHTMMGRLLRRISRFVSRRADAAIVVSERMKLLVGRTTPAYVVPSGIDLSLFRRMPQAESRERLGLPADGKLVLFVGDPELAVKRFDLARRAVDIMKEKCPGELVVAWKVDRTQIPLYLSACDVLVFTSVQEGSPTLIKEALACDLPIVSVPVGDVPERLDGVENCVLCTDDRPETIAEALQDVLQRGERCRGRDAIRELDETILAKRVVEIYRSVLPNTQDNGGIEKA